MQYVVSKTDIKLHEILDTSKKTEYSGLTGTTLCAAVVFVVSPGSQKKWSLFNTCKHFKRASKCTSSVLCNVEMQMHYLSLNINSAQLYFNITEYLCLLFSGIHITPLKAWSHMHSSPNPHHTDRFVQYNAFWKQIWHSFRSLHFLRTTHTQNIARFWIADEIFGVFCKKSNSCPTYALLYSVCCAISTTSIYFVTTPSHFAYCFIVYYSIYNRTGQVKCTEAVQCIFPEPWNFITLSFQKFSRFSLEILIL